VLAPRPHRRGARRGRPRGGGVGQPGCAGGGRHPLWLPDL